LATICNENYDWEFGHIIFVGAPGLLKRRGVPGILINLTAFGIVHECDRRTDERTDRPLYGNFCRNSRHRWCLQR